MFYKVCFDKYPGLYSLFWFIDSVIQVMGYLKVVVFEFEYMCFDGCHGRMKNIRFFLTY